VGTSHCVTQVDLRLWAPCRHWRVYGRCFEEHRASCTGPGPQTRPTDEAVLAERLAQTGIDPRLVGERVIDAIRSKIFYGFVSAVPADVMKARHRRIEAVLENRWTTSY
jgi:hypothetical protein